MKIGDLVKTRTPGIRIAPQTGVIVDIIQKKVWRTHEFGRKVNWDIVEPESHAVLLLAHTGRLSSPVPLLDLELSEVEQ